MGISLKWPDFVTGIAKWIGDWQHWHSPDQGNVLALR